jgi:hypothetical protein
VTDIHGDVSDEQLVEQFVNGQGEAGEGAFEVLLERHGPMVFRICRTILRDRHDAEDAFQATFLVLARRAHSIRQIPALAHAWEKAVIDGDVGTMDRLLAYELVGTDPEGWIWDKTKYLDHVKRRAQGVATVELKDIRIQVYGDAAVETGIGVGHYDQAKPPWIAARGHITERFTRTWIKRHGTWQCVAYQTMVTERAEDPGAGNTPPAGKTDSPRAAHANDAVPF